MLAEIKVKSLVTHEPGKTVIEEKKNNETHCVLWVVLSASCICEDVANQTFRSGISQTNSFSTDDS